jgi:hypothetical protein
MNGTFEAMVVGEKGTLTTGNSMHDLGTGKYRSATRPDTPKK